MDKDDLDGIEASLDQAEEISTVSVCSERYQGKYEDLCAVPDGIRKDKNKDTDGGTGTVFRGVKKSIDTAKEVSIDFAGDETNQGKDEDRNINTVSNGVEKDLGKGKDLIAVLTGVENYKSRDEDMCTVFYGVDKVLDKDEEVSTFLAGVEVDLGKDEVSSQSGTANQDGQMAEPDSMLLEPPEEFRVRFSYL